MTETPDRPEPSRPTDTGPRLSPVLFVTGDGTPVTEADLDAGIAQAMTATQPTAPDGPAIPYRAVRTAARVLAARITAGMTIGQVEDVAEEMLVTAFAEHGYRVWHNSSVERKVELAGGIIRNAESAMQDLRRHLDTLLFKPL